MLLFQKSVINKYISELDKDAVKNAWARYHAHCFHPAVQTNIRDAKEEEYQEDFVRDRRRIFAFIIAYLIKKI